MHELKAKLKSMGFTMADLARVSGVPYNSLNHYLNGYRKPGPSNTAKISEGMESLEIQYELKQMKVRK